MTKPSIRIAAGWACVLGGWLAGACSDPAPVLPPAGVPPHIVVRTDPASAAGCPYGGSVVRSGIDTNSDGVLEDAEVLTRAIVCNPAPAQPPPPIVLRLIAEPPGAHCAGGGTAVQSGPDQNGNGRLDDGEVAHVDYVCGQASLTRIVAEPPGARCIAGGVVFLAGSDRDGDGVLEDAEVQATDLECGDVLSRDVEVHAVAELAALGGIRIITGGLKIQGPGATEIVLPKLERVGGELRLEDLGTTRVSLPALQDVDGALRIGLPDLTIAELPRLQRVGGLQLEFTGLADLGGFSALTEVDGDVTITSMSSLASIDLSSLAIRGNLDVSFSGRLARVSLKLVGRVGGASFIDCPLLEALDLSVTAQTPGSGGIGGVEVLGNPKLARVALSAERMGSLFVGSNPVLGELALDVARVDLDVLVTGGTTPFHLSLSSPSPDGIELGGDLRIAGPLQALDATGPVIVGGQCMFHQTQLETLGLRSPLRVHQGLELSNNALLTGVSPIELTGSLDVSGNAALRSLSFVTPVDGGELGDVVIVDNPVLARAPSLAAVTAVRRNLNIEHNPMLDGVFGGSLMRIDGQAVIDHNASLTAIQLPHLLRIETNLEVFANDALQTIEVPAVTDVAAELDISSNPQLHHIAFDALAHAINLQVHDNPHLPACEVLAVFAHVDALGKGQSGNDNTATCP
jgi:hypothetical protein